MTRQPTLVEALQLDPDTLAGDLAAPGGSADALLQLARVLEPPLRLAERSAALERAAAVATSAATLREIDAERALDLTRHNALDDAERLATAVLAVAGPDEVIARARATEALGRAFAWRGTTAASARAKLLLAEAADHYAALGIDQWRGTVLFWCANSVHYQRGELAEAERGMRDALPLLGAARQAMVLSFLGDLLGCRGAVAEAAEVLSRAEVLAGGAGATLAYICWSRAKLASYTGDARLTLRLIREADRDLAGLGITNTVANFLADAADMLERVDEPGLASGYLARARRIAPDDEFVRVAEAAALARHGDPEAAITALRQVLLEPWLEARLFWRVTLLTAWAAFRAGHADAGSLAARALSQAGELGGIEVALTTEGFLVRALLPLAAAAGSERAAAMLHGPAPAVRLLGDLSVVFPPGQPGELARLVLTRAGGLTSGQVVELLWPDEDPELARRRLRQVLSRLRARLPGLVIRADDRLVGTAWVDTVAFEKAARAALARRDPQQAHAALALWGGFPLPADPYAAWAADLRERLISLRVRLLDFLAADAEARASYAEAARLLEAAVAEDRYDEHRYERAAAHRVALGQHAQAGSLRQQAAAMLTEGD